MPAYNFQPRFAAKVESGEKCQTIRRRRKRPTRPGETLYLYTDQRTKNARKLRPDNPKCTAVLPLEIHFGGVVVDGYNLSCSEIADFARADGFANVADFYNFWRDVHGLTTDAPLKGFELIQWEPKT